MEFSKLCNHVIIFSYVFDSERSIGILKNNIFFRPSVCLPANFAKMAKHVFEMNHPEGPGWYPDGAWRVPGQCPDNTRMVLDQEWDETMYSSSGR